MAVNEGAPMQGATIAAAGAVVGCLTDSAGHLAPPSSAAGPCSGGGGAAAAAGAFSSTSSAVPSGNIGGGAASEAGAAPAPEAEGGGLMELGVSVAWPGGRARGDRIVVRAGPHAGRAGTISALGDDGGCCRFDHVEGKGKGKRNKDVFVLAEDF